MKIAILGAGAIGSAFGYQLARGGHDLTMIARGARFAFLEQEGALVLGNGDRARVTVARALDETVDWDLVLVTVLAPQVAAVLPSLAASRAQTVMFMFNTFESIEPLRAAVRAERFAFGFPGGVFAQLLEGRIHAQIRSGTTVSEPRWAELFQDAAIPTVVEPDMQSWLRTHAALVAPLMAASVIVAARGGGISWAEAGAHGAALQAGLRIVRAAGNPLLPSSLRYLKSFPRVVLTAMLWLFSRTKVLRDLGALGRAEPRMLIDMMSASSPELAGPLRAIRP